MLSSISMIIAINLYNGYHAVLSCINTAYLNVSVTTALVVTQWLKQTTNLVFGDGKNLDYGIFPPFYEVLKLRNRCI